MRSVDSVPDEEIGRHLFWLSGENWAERLQCCFPDRGNQGAAGRVGEQFRRFRIKIRLVRLSISDYLTQNGTGHNAEKKFALFVKLNTMEASGYKKTNDQTGMDFTTTALYIEGNLERVIEKK